MLLELGVLPLELLLELLDGAGLELGALLLELDEPLDPPLGTLAELLEGGVELELELPVPELPLLGLPVLELDELLLGVDELELDAPELDPPLDELEPDELSVALTPTAPPIAKTSAPTLATKTRNPAATFFAMYFAK